MNILNFRNKPVFHCPCGIIHPTMKGPLLLLFSCETFTMNWEQELSSFKNIAKGQCKNHKSGSNDSCAILQVLLVIRCEGHTEL